MFYSFKNQYPSELPNRIRLSNGLTRTDNTTFTDQEILDAGYVPVADPPAVDSTRESLLWIDGQWVVHPITEEEAIAKAWNNVRTIRNGSIQNLEWRVSRYLSQVRLGLDPVDDIAVLDAYAQALRDITKQTDVFNIVWPDLPNQLNIKDTGTPEINT